MRIASALWTEEPWLKTTPVGANHKTQLTKDFGLLVLWGGEDISPSLYGESVTASHARPLPSQRDEAEVALIEQAVALQIPILGICRGAQLLCAYGGGKLWQHADNHVIQHHDLVNTKTGEVSTTNSCHHQIMRPTEEMEVLWHATKRSQKKVDGTGKKVEDPEEVEPEIVYFPKLNAIGVQGHPEWLPHSHPLNQITAALLKEKFDVHLHGR